MDFLRRHRWALAGTVAVIALAALVELGLGRSLLGPDGKFGWWDGNIWSSENSQRVLDAYSFSHVIHGILFYALLWLAARRVPVEGRFLIALLAEAGWEVLENSPLIIDRYREATIALGYVGDSVLNSCSDILMMGVGFLIARRAKAPVSAALVVVLEVGCLIWVRDNLTLNVLMLLHPIPAIKAWQTAGRPLP